jgi:hypothetical protein
MKRDQREKQREKWFFVKSLLKTLFNLSIILSILFCLSSCTRVWVRRAKSVKISILLETHSLCVWWNIFLTWLWDDVSFERYKHVFNITNIVQEYTVSKGTYKFVCLRAILVIIILVLIVWHQTYQTWHVSLISLHVLLIFIVLYNTIIRRQSRQILAHSFLAFATYGYNNTRYFRNVKDSHIRVEWKGIKLRKRNEK